MPKRDNISNYISGAARRAGNLSRPLKIIGTYMLRSIAKNFQAGGRPEKWQQSLRARLQGKKTGGRLSSATTFKATAKKLILSNNKIGARIFHKGGDIKPKSKKALTVPISKQALGKKASDFDNTFVIKGIIFQKRARKPIPLFALKKKVTIPARPFLLAQDEDERFINDRISDWLVEGK
jgi:phage gpG-like protein